MITPDYQSIGSIRELPKADRHLHLLLSAPLQVYREISPSLIPNPPGYSYGTLQEFLRHVNTYFLPILSSLAAVRAVVRGALQHMIADGVTYAEASLPLTAPARIGTNWDCYAALVSEELAAVKDQLTIRLELGHAREIPVDWRALSKEALRTGVFSGIDLYGNEAHGEISEFADFFTLARSKNLYVKIHCGECTGAARMRRDVEFVRPDAIQHGIASASDRALMELLHKWDTPCNVCPTSNLMTGQVKTLAQHPLRVMVAHGVTITIASDDYGLFGTSLSEEYYKILAIGLLSQTQLEQIRLHSLPSQ